MIKKEEEYLKSALIVMPEFIEEGLTVKDREVHVGKGMKCDLLYVDRNGKDLYIEVKIKAEDRAVGQIVKYSTLVNNPDARYMVAAQEYGTAIKDALDHIGYEYCHFNRAEVDEQLTKTLAEEKSNKIIARVKSATKNGR